MKSFLFLGFYLIIRRLQTISADSLRLKCDAPPYRTFYSDCRCYVAVLEEYCGEQVMVLPALENDVDNRIVKGWCNLTLAFSIRNSSGALIKDPVWVQKSFGGQNSGFKWNQARNYAKWTTCDGPTGQNPRLCQCLQNRFCLICCLQLRYRFPKWEV